ncbi:MULTISPECIES: hypothetical protein [Haloarcula]|nr:hypothetical protein [Haloarcula sp. GH36]
MDVKRSRTRTERLVSRCRRKVLAVDRGWKATALGVTIVLATTLAP